MIMSISNLVSRASGSNASDKVPYSLNEICAILEMLEGKMAKKDIAQLTGRTAFSLQYKIFENKTTINGKTNCRSVMKHLFVEPTSKTNHEIKDEVAFLTSLYTSFSVAIPTDIVEDAKARSLQWSVEAGLIEATTEEIVNG
jgi:hypothetical protein